MASSKFEIPINIFVEGQSGISRINEPVSIGLPLPKGLFVDTSKFVLLRDSHCILPIQIKVISRWYDNSLRRILLEFFADITTENMNQFVLIYSDSLSSCNNKFIMKFSELEKEIFLSTGEVDFFISKKIFKPFNRVVAQGYDVIEKSESRVVFVDDMNAEYEPKIKNFFVETEGSVRSTLCVQGELISANHSLLADFIARLNFFANNGLVELKLTLRNPRAAHHTGGLWDLGDPGSVIFRDLTISFGLKASDKVSIEWISEASRSYEQATVPHIVIYQDSSGGPMWRSSNHVNRFGRIPSSFQGYRVTSGNRLLYEGERATPVLALYDDKKGITATIDKFWQNYPKALEVEGDCLNIRLFPRQYGDVYELQGGEQKTHTVFLQFSAGQELPGEIRWVHDRLIARTTPEWYAKTNAYSYLTPLSMDKHAECQGLINSAIEGPYNFFERREVIDEYGWRHFGDLYADHEAVGYYGDKPLVSHYNNQYDAIYGAIVQYARSGNSDWFRLMEDLAKHVIDIDIYHTHEDRPVYNGGMFWHTDHYVDAGTSTHRTYSRVNFKEQRQSYGGGPSNEHNYTSGLLHYYYLTGDMGAHEAVLSLAEWVMQMDEGSHRLLGWLDRRPTGFASSTVNWDFHGPGRGAGNSINALLDAHMLTEETRYLAKAEELIQRCVHPKDDIEKHDLRDVEHRWSYTVFLQALGKYLDFKVEKDQIDYMYSYARFSLIHYASWMLKYEVPYKQVLDKVELPTETWPAQDIRKSNVFNFAAKYAEEPLRSAFLEKADTFFQACISDLLSFETCRLTRPIVLLMSNAFIQTYFDVCPDESAPRSSRGYDFGKPRNFTPQFYELYKAREKLSMLTGAIQALKQCLCGKRYGGLYYKGK